MASELRVNSSTNRSGLGTVTYTDSGPIVSGVGTFTNGLTVDGTQTTVKSLKLTGDNYNANWFKTTNKLRFNDNSKATFGTSDDLSIFHNASDSVITHGAGGTGNLKILSGGAQSIECIKAGAVNIAHNGSTKLATSSTGVTITGTAVATTFAGNGDFVDIDVDGHTDLDNVSVAGVTTFSEDTKFIGALSGRDLQWDKSDNTLEFLDYTAAKFGTDNNLTIYHNAGNNNSYISENGVGSLLIQASDLYLTNTAGEYYVICATDGRVQLNFNNNPKFETTNTGAVVTGICTATSFSGDHIGITTFSNGDINGISFPLNVKNDNNHNDYDMGTGIKLQGGGSTEFYKWCAIVARGENNGVGGYSNSQALAFYTYNNYGASGGTEKVRISSDGDVGIGTDSPQSAGLTVLRNSEARLQVWANGDGSNGKIALRADGTNTQMGTWSNHDIHLVRNATIQATVNSNGISFPAGKGIDFSATSNANGTMESELFADYERGTHTYSVTGSTSDPTVNTGSYNKLYYTKVGDMVHVTGELRWTISSHGSGHLRISLPFTSNSTANSNSQGTAQTWNVNWKYGRSDAEYLLSEVLPGTNYIIFRVACNNSLNEPYLNCGSNYQKTSNSGYGVEYQVSIWYRTG